MKEKVLQAMREFGAPVNAGKIAEITGIERKDVEKGGCYRFARTLQVGTKREVMSELCLIVLYRVSDEIESISTK